eukprot:6222830-Pyramimonas_sp.AAC.1
MGETEGGSAEATSGLTPCVSDCVARENGKEEGEDGRSWLQEYLGAWVQKGQEFRQNHVHQWSKRLQRVVPLAHCQRKDDMTQCKSFFPRTAWLIDRA